MDFDWRDAGYAHGRAGYWNGETTIARSGFDTAWTRFERTEESSPFPSRAKFGIGSAVWTSCLYTFELAWSRGYRDAMNARLVRDDKFETLPIYPGCPSETWGMVGVFGEVYYIRFSRVRVPELDPMRYMLDAVITPYVTTANYREVWYFAPPARDGSGPYDTREEAQANLRRYAGQVMKLNVETTKGL